MIANTSVVTNEEDNSQPTLGFQKNMRNSSHPDFGMDFAAALSSALAKEKKSHVVAAPETS